jgi:hypothetical protein
MTVRVPTLMDATIAIPSRISWLRVEIRLTAG